MRFNKALFNISEKKILALMAKIESLDISLDDIEEKFSRGSGAGGQKINKTSIRVQLCHIPTGIKVVCQRERERNKNRFIALRALVEKIELKLYPGMVREDRFIEKLRKQKKRRQRRGKSKE